MKIVGIATVLAVVHMATGQVIIPPPTSLNTQQGSPAPVVQEQHAKQNSTTASVSPKIIVGSNHKNASAEDPKEIGKDNPCSDPNITLCFELIANEMNKTRAMIAEANKTLTNNKREEPRVVENASSNIMKADKLPQGNGSLMIKAAPTTSTMQQLQQPQPNIQAQASAVKQQDLPLYAPEQQPLSQQQLDQHHILQQQAMGRRRRRKRAALRRIPIGLAITDLEMDKETKEEDQDAVKSIFVDFPLNADQVRAEEEKRKAMEMRRSNIKDFNKDNEALKEIVDEEIATPDRVLVSHGAQTHSQDGSSLNANSATLSEDNIEDELNLIELLAMNSHADAERLEKPVASDPLAVIDLLSTERVLKPKVIQELKEAVRLSAETKSKIEQDETKAMEDLKGTLKEIEQLKEIAERTKLNGKRVKRQTDLGLQQQQQHIPSVLGQPINIGLMGGVGTNASTSNDLNHDGTKNNTSDTSIKNPIAIGNGAPTTTESNHTSISDFGAANKILIGNSSLNAIPNVLSNDSNLLGKEIGLNKANSSSVLRVPTSDSRTNASLNINGMNTADTNRSFIPSISSSLTSKSDREEAELEAAPAGLILKVVKKGESNLKLNQLVDGNLNPVNVSNLPSTKDAKMSSDNKENSTLLVPDKASLNIVRNNMKTNTSNQSISNVKSAQLALDTSNTTPVLGNASANRQQAIGQAILQSKSKTPSSVPVLKQPQLFATHPLQPGIQSQPQNALFTPMPSVIVKSDRVQHDNSLKPTNFEDTKSHNDLFASIRSNGNIPRANLERQM